LAAGREPLGTGERDALTGAAALKEILSWLLTHYDRLTNVEHVFVSEVRAELQALVGSLDAAVLEPAEAERLVREFALIEHAAAAGKALAAKRVAESGKWRKAGVRSEAEWLAQTTGESVGAARAALDTANHLRDAPATAEVFRRGELSTAQARVIASAAVADPSAERSLLDMAEQAPLTKLRERCARVRAAATPDLAERHRRIHRERYWRTWTDGEGARCGQYRMTPEQAALVETAARPFADAAFEQARAEGREESSEAYAADGLVAMARAAQSGDGGGATKREVIALVNLESLRRGHVHPGETCEIPGVGPVPVDVARGLFGDALLRVVIRDGVDIRTVCHAGRQPNAAQRTAVFVRDGGRCVRPSCRRPIAEIDHTDDYSRTRHTTLGELAGLCVGDHRLKTHSGHTYRHGDSGWEWHLPDGTIETERPPPPDP
jgi:hypothetical protein